MALPIIIIVAIAVALAYLLVSGDDYMREHHPDYKGEDLFGEDESQENDKI